MPTGPHWASLRRQHLSSRPKCRLTRRKTFPGRVPQSAKALGWESGQLTEGRSEGMNALSSGQRGSQGPESSGPCGCGKKPGFLLSDLRIQRSNMYDLCFHLLACAKRPPFQLLQFMAYLGKNKAWTWRGICFKLACLGPARHTWKMQQRKGPPFDTFLLISLTTLPESFLNDFKYFWPTPGPASYTQYYLIKANFCFFLEGSTNYLKKEKLSWYPSCGSVL